MFPTVSFSFDDGLSSVAAEAFPILNERSFPATVYLITSRIGKPEFLSLVDINMLIDHGWEIGSHTQNHPKLVECSESELDQELAGSKKILEEAIFKSSNQVYGVKGIAFPYGGADAIGKREILYAKKYYEYSRLNLNRSGLISPHIVEETTLKDPINSSLLFGRNPSFGGLRDFKLNVNAAVKQEGWFIFYTHGLDSKTVPNISEFRKMVEYTHTLVDSGKLHVSTVSDLINTVEKIDDRNSSTDEGMKKDLIDPLFSRWLSTSRHTFVSKAFQKYLYLLRAVRLK